MEARMRVTTRVGMQMRAKMRTPPKTMSILACLSLIPFLCRNSSLIHFPYHPCRRTQLRLFYHIRLQNRPLHQPPLHHRRRRLLQHLLQHLLRHLPLNRMHLLPSQFPRQHPPPTGYPKTLELHRLPLQILLDRHLARLRPRARLPVMIVMTMAVTTAMMIIHPHQLANMLPHHQIELPSQLLRHPMRRKRQRAPQKSPPLAVRKTWLALSQRP